MRLSGSIAALGVALCLASGNASAHTEAYSAPENVRILTIALESKADLEKLVAAGFDVAGVNFEDMTVDVIVDPNTEMSFESGLPAYRGMTDLKILKSQWLDAKMAPDPNYKTPQEIEQILSQYAADYPHLARMVSYGTSLEGRPLWALKITDNPDERELDEPTILFNGMHHAREVMTPEIVLDTIEWLLTNYGTDARATAWVDNSEIWLVPMVNPDGNNKVWTQYSMWRKNTRGGYGVDINRNYPYAWGRCNGSSGSTGSETYRGPEPASEPETQALMSLVAAIEPVFDISYHSYSELVLYPYGCRGSRTPTEAVVAGIGRAMAAGLPRDSGRGTYTAGTPWEVLYAVDGDDTSWMYNAYNVIPYVIEVNSSSLGFQPAYRYRQPTVEKLRSAWMLLFERLTQSGIRGIVTDGSGRTVPEARVTVQSMGQADLAPFTWKIKGDGTYHLVLDPGMYKLTFVHGDRTIEQEVLVGADLVNLDIEL